MIEIPPWILEVLKNFVLPLTVSMIGTSFTLWLNKRGQTREKKEAARRKTKNVQQYNERYERRWKINPYWIRFDGNGPVLEGYPDETLCDERLPLEIKNKYGTEIQPSEFECLKQSTVLEARKSLSWMIFRQAEGRLEFYNFVPATDEEADLFRELKTGWRRLLPW